MKNKFLQKSIILVLFFAITPIFAQDMAILRSTGFTNTQNLIDGTAAYTGVSSTGHHEIVVELLNANYIYELELIINSGYMYNCKISYSTDDSNYQLLGEAYLGTNNIFTVNNSAKYIKIDCGTAGHIYLQELIVSTQHISIAYTYDAAGNRITRILSISEQGTKSASTEGIQKPEGTLNWEELGVKLFPNPTLGELIIEFENFPEKQKVKMELYDFAGKKIAKEKIYNNSFMLNIESYPSGTYLLRLIVGQEQKTYQIIKK